jgi:glutamyl-tRNA reductase
VDTIAERLTACCWDTLALDRAGVSAAQALVRAAHPAAAIVVSCQRTEAYSLAPCACTAPRRLSGFDALLHLAEVAAGLHSVVLGEAQILGQVRDGFAATDGDLRKIGDLALAAARELRRATRFNSHAGALLDRALKVVGREPGGELLVLGAGQLGRLVAERGLFLGFDRVTVASRTRPAWWDGPFVGLTRITRAGSFAVIATCLGSTAAELARSALPPAELIVDLGTPRNVGEGQAAPVVALAAMLADENRRPHALRRRHALQAELRLKVEARLGAAAVSPVAAMRDGVERIRQRELARIRRLHPELPPATVDVITRALLNQVFHAPSARLRASGDADFEQRVAALFA